MEDKQHKEDRYVKFVVTAHCGANDRLRVPWTGVDGAMRHVRELVSDGYTVEIAPFTREEWGGGRQDNGTLTHQPPE